MCKMISIVHVVAASENNVIGINGDLPWHIPEDLQFFKDATIHKPIIMGRKTFESLPNKKGLPKRLNIVITRQDNYQAENAHVFKSLEEALDFAKSQKDQYGEELCIIGGGEIFKQSLEITQKVFLTRVHTDIKDGDAFYPELPDHFEKVESIKKTQEDGLSYSFETFVNKKA